MKYMNAKVLSVITALLVSSAAISEQFFCEGQIKGTDYTKEIKLTVNAGSTHVLTLAPTKPEYKSEIASIVPVGIGKIEVTERARKTGMVIASGMFIVTQKDEHIITGIHNSEARPGLIRLDKNGQIWNFVYYDSSHENELVFGSCK